MGRLNIDEARDKNESDKKSALTFYAKLRICVIIAALLGGNIIGYYFMGSEITFKVAPVSALICGGLILASKKGWLDGPSGGSGSGGGSGGCGGGGGE